MKWNRNKRRWILPCLTGVLLLGGCSSAGIPMAGLELYDRYFGQTEEKVAEDYNLGWDWTREETSGRDFRNNDYQAVTYTRTLNPDDGGSVTIELRFVEGFGLAGIHYQAGAIPTDRETFFENAMALYNWCEDHFGEPGLATEQDQAEYERYLSAIWSSNAIYGMPQSEGLDWTAYGEDAEIFFENTYEDTFSGCLNEYGKSRLTTFWWGTEEEFPGTNAELRAECINPYDNETNANYEIIFKRDITDWSVTE